MEERMVKFIQRKTTILHYMQYRGILPPVIRTSITILM